MSTDVITIDSWFSRYPFPKFVQLVEKRAREFEAAHPQYRINVKTSWWQKLPEEVMRSAAQGNPPAMASYYTGAVQLARDTFLPDGQPLYTSVGKALGGRTEILGEPVIINDLIPAAREFYTFNGDLSSMPLTVSTMQLYTNVTALRAAGIPEVPQTWDQAGAACEAVARRAHGPAHGIAWVIDGKFFQHALAQQAAIFANQQNGRNGLATTIDLATSEMLAYVGWWNDLHKRGKFLYTGRMQDWEGTFAAFTNQQIAFRLSSSFDAKYMVAGGKDAGFDVVASPVPRRSDLPHYGNWLGGDSLWLADGLDDDTRDGALAFMQYLNSPQNAAQWHKEYGSAPVTSAAVKLLDEEGWFEQHPYFRTATEQLDMMTGPATQAVLGPFARIQRAAMQGIEDVLTRGADPGRRFAEVSAEGQRLLDDYNFRCRVPGVRSADCFLVDS